jgi:chromate transporter
MSDDKQPPDGRAERPSVSQVFLAFLRLGVTAFGGPAMVPYIGEMAVSKKQWLSGPSFKEGVAVAQTIPGATAMQIVAYVGLRSGGVGRAAAACLGFGLPAFLLMVALSAVYGMTHSSPISLSVFQGLQVIVVAIIAKAAFTFGRTIVRGWQDAIIGLVAGAYLAYDGNPMLAIVLGAAAGLLLYMRGTTTGESGESLDTPSLRSTTRPVLLLVLAVLVGLVALLLVNRHLFDLAALMLRIDMFAFGGGFASVPLMLHEVVGVRQWMTTQVFMDGIAMGQVTPGPIVITATFVGYQHAGILGALCATTAIFFPSFVLLTLVVPHFDRIKANPSFQSAMRGILASFVGLLLAVLLRFGLAVPWTPVSALLVGGAFTALMLKVEVPWVVVPGALLSALLFHQTKGG